MNVDRTRALRRKALELALHLYSARQAPAQRLGSLQQQLAWCMREDGDDEVERGWLSLALESYKVALELVSDNSLSEELRLTYLCGEISLRLDAPDEAQAWFWHVVRHPDSRKYPAWQRMAQTGWEHARERIKARRTQPRTPAPD